MGRRLEQDGALSKVSAALGPVVMIAVQRQGFVKRFTGHRAGRFNSVDFVVQVLPPRAIHFAFHRHRHVLKVSNLITGLVEHGEGVVVLFEGHLVGPFGVFRDRAVGEEDVFLTYPAPMEFMEY